ncbi:MAG: polysaccharide deacetylase family protein [Candidatus Helarchaeota archaeon]
MKIAITVDVEPDPIKDSFFGVKYGLPKILKIFDETKIHATFFITGEIAEKFPDLVRNLNKKHEIGMHGIYKHERLRKVDDRIINEIIEIKNNIESIIQTPIYGFRAPFLDIDARLLVKLKDLGFKYDSSLGLFRFNQIRMEKFLEKGFEFKVLFPNVFFRFPMGLKAFQIFYSLNRVKLAIFYLHPWEAINVRYLLKKYKMYQSTFDKIFRIDRWLNTGTEFLKRLKKFIIFFKNKDFEINTLKNYSKIK